MLYKGRIGEGCQMSVDVGESVTPGVGARQARLWETGTLGESWVVGVDAESYGSGLQPSGF